MGCTQAKISPEVIEPKVSIVVNQTPLSPLLRRSVSNQCRRSTQSSGIMHRTMSKRYQDALYDINIMSHYQQMYFQRPHVSQPS